MIREAVDGAAEVVTASENDRPGGDSDSRWWKSGGRDRVDEFTIALSPVLFGSGTRLFEGVDAARLALEPVRAEPMQRTYLTYAVVVSSPSTVRRRS